MWTCCLFPKQQACFAQVVGEGEVKKESTRNSSLIWFFTRKHLLCFVCLCCRPVGRSMTTIVASDFGSQYQFKFYFIFFLSPPPPCPGLPLSNCFCNFLSMFFFLIASNGCFSSSLSLLSQCRHGCERWLWFRANRSIAYETPSPNTCSVWNDTHSLSVGPEPSFASILFKKCVSKTLQTVQMVYADAVFYYFQSVLLFFLLFKIGFHFHYFVPARPVVNAKSI